MIATARICRPLLLPSLLACAPAAPDQVWVPDGEGDARLVIPVELPADRLPRPGESIPPQVWRGTGRWTLVSRSTVGAGKRWLATPPAQEEFEVQAKLGWHAGPEGRAAPKLPNATFELARNLSFDAPGSQRLSATNHTRCSDPIDSNAIAISVGAPRAPARHGRQAAAPRRAESTFGRGAA